MLKRILLPALFIISSFSFSQDYSLIGIIEDFSNKKLYLTDFYGDQKNIIDSTLSDETGKFEFYFSEEMPVGQYRILVENNFIDIIFNKEDIQFITSNLSPNENIEIINSDENRLYYDYLYNRNLCQFKIDLLSDIIDYYPEHDIFYATAKKEYIFIQKKFSDFVNDLLKNNPESYVARIAAFERKSFKDPELSPFARKAYEKFHFFDYVNFNDTLLLHSNVISSKIVSYLSFYQDKRFSKEQLENSFIQAVDTLMLKAFDNEKVYEFVVEYLIKGFDRFGFTKVISHIAEYSGIGEKCVNKKRKSELERRIEGINKMAIGNQAPEIRATDINGNEVILSEIEKENTLVVFWASSCPHCTRFLQQLKKTYNKNINDLEIITISIDTSRSEYLNYINKNNYKWINVCDFNGWDSKPAHDYSVYATPTIYLLNKNKMIIGQPASVGEIKDMLRP
ncbi:MAG: redoxin domain-containing protein [Bacteroidales bacterium]|nr:redoxin domain-containing protein [Bacteroidales bacterium]